MEQKSQNNTYKEIWDEIKKHKQITICSHITTDGDTIGTAIALKHLILLNTNIKEIKISGEPYPRYLSFLEKTDSVSDDFFNNSLKIVVDTSTKHRIFDKRVITKDSIKIDHHHHEGEWKLEIGGDYWPAAGQILFEMIKELNLETNKTIDEALFVSIWTDTEGMVQRNINETTHEAINSYSYLKEETLLKTALTKEEKELIKTVEIFEDGNITYGISEKIISNDIYREFVNHIYNNSRTEIVIAGTKQKEGYRFGLRSKGNKDISGYAEKMGGGGHYSSSGFNILNNNNQEVMKTIYNLIKEINNEW